MVENNEYLKQMQYIMVKTKSVFNFQVGHDIPKSKGGEDKIHNLKPCSSCNLSMKN